MTVVLEVTTKALILISGFRSCKRNLGARRSHTQSVSKWIYQTKSILKVSEYNQKWTPIKSEHQPNKKKDQKLIAIFSDSTGDQKPQWRDFFRSQVYSVWPRAQFKFNPGGLNVKPSHFNTQNPLESSACDVLDVRHRMPYSVFILRFSLRRPLDEATYKSISMKVIGGFRNIYVKRLGPKSCYPIFVAGALSCIFTTDSRSNS